MNQALECIQNRYSCRAFTGAKTADDVIQKIVQAAIQSPSSMNRQRWQVIAVRNAGLIAELEAEGLGAIAALPDKSTYERIQARGGRLFYNAPCIVFIAIDPGDLAGASLDAGIVAQSIAIAAQAVGLASCICGLAGLAFSENKAAYFKEKLRFPAGYEFGIAVLLGEAAGSGTPHAPNPDKTTFID
ncbi:MAG: nitroreductase family protein [Oscillospiraceae bacterium]